MAEFTSLSESQKTKNCQKLKKNWLFLRFQIKIWQTVADSTSRPVEVEPLGGKNTASRKGYSEAFRLADAMVED